MQRPSTTGRRARAHLATLALAAGVVSTALLVGSGSANAQEEQAPPTQPPSEQPPPPEQSTTTTEPPPSTIVLDDGDFGVVPPGAENPSGDQPPPTDPPPGEGDGAGELAVPEELPVVILPDPTPGLNAALASIDIVTATRRLDEAFPVLAGARAELAAAADRRREAVASRRAALRTAVDARQVIETLAVNALMFGDVASLAPMLDIPDLDQLRDLELRDVTADHIEATFDAAVDDYLDALTREADATRQLQAAHDAKRLADAFVVGRRAELNEAIEDARTARRRVGPTILGSAAVETPDLVAWYRTYYRADPPVAPIGTLIEAYLRIGEEEGVAGDIAFAQAILETGGFRSQHARGYNFAGIGAYDSCSPTCGFRFPDLDAGVRAHIQLLRAYAEPGLTRDQLAAPPDPRLAPERVGVRGCCPRWTSLTGVWASDPNYDRKVLGIYRLMVETARSLDRQQP